MSGNIGANPGAAYSARFDHGLAEYLTVIDSGTILQGSGALLSGTTNAAGRSAPPIPDNPSPVTYCNSTNTLTPETVTRISTSSNSVNRADDRSSGNNRKERQRHNTGNTLYYE